MYVSCPFHLGQIHKLILYALHLVMFILDCYVLRTLHFRKYKNECRPKRFPVLKSSYLSSCNKANFTMWNCMSASYETHCFVSWKKISCSKKCFMYFYVGTGREKEKLSRMEIVSALFRLLCMLFFARNRWPKWKHFRIM